MLVLPGLKAQEPGPAPALPTWVSRPEEDSPIERLCSKDSDFSSPAVKSVKNRMDIKWFYNSSTAWLPFFLGIGQPRLGRHRSLMV